MVNSRWWTPAFMLMSVGIIVSFGLYNHQPSDHRSSEKRTIATNHTRSRPIDGNLRTVQAKGILPLTQPLTLEDIIIGVSTTGKFHDSRLRLILQTWWPLAENSIYFFTDVPGTKYEAMTGGHLINTKCGSTHSKKDLSCKMTSQLNFFFLKKRKWFCHFDDDNYVNVPVLLSTLRNYSPNEDVYLGRASVPAEIPTRRDKGRITFQFGTGGAGFCISQKLMHKMKPYIGRNKFHSVDEWVSDDAAVGLIINHILGVNFTELPTFHSHLERLAQIAKDQLPDQISLSYGFNRIEAFPETPGDWTSIRRIHCHLFSKAKGCAKLLS